MLETRRSLAVALRTIQVSVSFGSVKSQFGGENPEVSQKRPTSLLLTLTSREDLEPRQLFGVPPCRKGPIYSRELMLSLGFDPRSYVGLFGEFSVTEDTFTASLYSGTLVDGMKSIINGTSKWNDSLLHVGYYGIPSIP
ncbi:hypothetical protein TNCV_1542921 [Trichonephila clavipes]|nr:hypothetical protein TNCV_1542921 [Trichonephila clavipes]